MTASDIKKGGISTIEDALVMLNPSFSFRPTAMSTNMTLNGMKGDYILVLVNGKKMTGDISGYVDLSRIDMGRVKRIEVLKGAASSLYGSDAIAGVINIITDQPHDALNIVSTTRLGGKGSFIETSTQTSTLANSRPQPLIKGANLTAGNSVISQKIVYLPVAKCLIKFHSDIREPTFCLRSIKKI